MQKVDREVLTEYLQAFDLQSDGYTLLVPSNTAMYLDSSGNPSSAPLLEAYNLTKADITVPLATAVRMLQLAQCPMCCAGCCASSTAPGM